MHRRSLLAAAVLMALAAPSAQAADDPENTLVMTLKCGEVVIRLRPDLAPKHAAQIKQLTRAKFYDGVVFHRVIDGFIAQTGDPTGAGMGGSSLPNIPAEFSAEPFRRGTVGMARAQNPDSANSQFFIMFADGAFLNGKYTVIGEVVKGMDCIDQINKGEPPLSPDTIMTLRVQKDT